MAFVPLPLGLTQGGYFTSGRVLKTYLAGTSTATPMYTDNTGATSTATVLYDANGLPTVSGSVVFPHINTAVGDVKYVLYPSQASADANTGALETWDNVSSTVASETALATSIEYHLYSEFVANVITLTNAYSPGNGSLSVYRNGVLLRIGAGFDYTETSTTSVTLTSDLAAIAAADDVFTFKIGAEQTTASLASSSVTYTPSGAGAVATDVQSKFRLHSVTPQDYGAVGDGVADDTTAVQAAFTTGKDVYFPKGTYKTTSQLTLSSAYQTIKGHKSALISYTPSGRLSAIHVTANNVTIKGVRIDCNTTSSTQPWTVDSTEDAAISFAENVDDLTVEDCTISNTGLCGVAGVGNHENIVIRNNKFIDIGFTSVKLSTSSTKLVTDSIIEGNHMLRMDQDGVGTVAMTRCTIADNVIKYPQVAGIALEARCDYTTVTGNVILGQTSALYGTYPNGIQVNDSEGVTVTGNTVQDARGITVSGDSTSGQVSVTGNILKSCGRDADASITVSTSVAGSLFSPFDYFASVVGNQIKDSYTSGILLSLVGHCTVTGNTVNNVNLSNDTTTDRRMAGICLRRNVNYCTISDNTLVEDTAAWNKVGIMDVSEGGWGSFNNSIKDNHIAGFDTSIVITENATYQSKVEVGDTLNAAPTSDSWSIGMRVYDATPTTGGHIGWVCTTAGTFETISTTFNCTSGDAFATATSTDGIYCGTRITLAGAGVAGADIDRTVTEVNRTTKVVSFNGATSTTVSGGALTQVTPVFKTFGAVS